MRSGLRKVALSALAAGAAVAQGRAAPPGPVTLGPFAPNPAFTLYLVNDAADSEIRLRLDREKPEVEEDATVRVFDPDETIVYRKHIDATGTDGELLDETLRLGRAGIYQVRVTAGHRQALVRLELPHVMGYGVSFQNGYYSGWPWWTEENRKLYVYVPPRAEELAVGGPRRFTIRDENGQAVPFEKGVYPENDKARVERTGVVWTFEFPDAGMGFLARGFPLILCSSRETAERIGGSVEQLADGTVVAHKFQARVQQCLHEILQPEFVGRAEELLADLEPYQEAFLRDPARNQILLREFDGLLLSINPVLRSQNVDPESHWGGAVIGWREREDKPFPANRWDRLQGVEGLTGGASHRSVFAAAEKLGLAALLDHPANPYYGRKELLYRAAAIALRDLITLDEDETWRGVGDIEPYSGHMAFVIGQRDLPAFAVVAPHMPAHVRKVWTEGVRRLVDRFYSSRLLACRNQTAHFLSAFAAFAEGTGERQDRELARAFARRFAGGASPAGYHMEYHGPDATYSGMTHWHMAVAYRMTGDPVILESIRKSYRFFNHTVAPEPDGTPVGASDFCHRTKEGFHYEQWGGATGILDDVLPEVSMFKDTWYLNGPFHQSEQMLDARRDRIRRVLADPPAGLGINAFNLAWPRYEHRAAPLDGAWPASEKESFVRELGGELVAVKRPGYYTAIYVGKPYPDRGCLSRAARMHGVQLPPDIGAAFTNSRPVEVGGSYYSIPITGGGMSLFWTPAYGNCVLGQNWSPLTHHGLLACDAEGKGYWEDYYSVQHEMGAGGNGLTVRGRLMTQPVSYTRRYTFNDHELRIDLHLESDGDCSLARFAEIVPILTGDDRWKPGKPEMRVADGKQDRILILDRHQQGIAVELRRPAPIELRDGLRMKAHGGFYQVSRIELVLPERLKAGDEVELSYVLSAHAAPQGGTAGSLGASERHGGGR